MVNSNRELVLVRNLRWLNKEKYSFSVHFIPFFPSTLFLFSKTRIHSASGGQEMLIRSEEFNQGNIYENEGTWGTRLFQCYFGPWIIERLDRKLMSRGLISYRRLVGSCSKMALDGSIIVEICDETMAKMWRKPVEM